MLGIKIIMCSLMMVVVGTTNAQTFRGGSGLNKCCYCGASTHTSDHCNRRPEGTVNEKGQVLTKGRWATPTKPLDVDKPVCSNCGGMHSVMNCPSPQRNRNTNQGVSSAETTPSAGSNTTHEKELAAWNEKKKQETITRSQAQSIQKTSQELVSLNEQNSALEKQKAELETKVKELEKQVLELLEQAKWYEKYARTLHKQLGFSPVDFKVFQK